MFQTQIGVLEFFEWGQFAYFKHEEFIFEVEDEPPMATNDTKSDSVLIRKTKSATKRPKTDHMEVLARQHEKTN